MKSFEELRELVLQGGTAIEDYRQELVNDLLEKTQPHNKPIMEQLWWRIQGINKRHTPLASAIEISKLMWERHGMLRYVLNDAIGPMQQLEQLASPVVTQPKLTLVKNSK